MSESGEMKRLEDEVKRLRDDLRDLMIFVYGGHPSGFFPTTSPDKRPKQEKDCSLMFERLVGLNEQFEKTRKTSLEFQKELEWRIRALEEKCSQKRNSSGN